MQKKLFGLILWLAFGVMRCWSATLVQEFYLPMPEAQLYQALSTIQPSIGSAQNSIYSIIVTGDGTVIYYDQWEDGYETDLSAPTQPTTQIWGDGNDAHGIPPGFAHNPLGLKAGTIITLTNNVPLPRNPSVLLYDGGDRIGATKAIVVTHAGWPVNPGPVDAGAVSVLSTIDYGTNYISPVGQDLTNNLFKYVGLFVMAAQDGTTVTIDPDGPGPAAPVTMTLNQGQSYLVNGGIKKGASVVASKPVQADLMIGHVGASYAADWFTLYPVEQWSATYYTPVSTAASGNPAFVYLYNPNPASITINYSTLNGSGSFTVGATNGVYQYQMPKGSGAKFASASGANFYALCTVGANPSSDTAYNWGFTLLPTGGLTTEADVGWAPGSSDGTKDGSPVWVTPLAPTRIYVDYKGDHAGPLIDSKGNHYDTNYDLVTFQSMKIYDPSRDQTGMRVYTLDGTLISAVWGEDADVAAPGNPYIDAGTTVLPFPVPVLNKSSVIVTDAPPAGLSVGDTLEYTVELDNKGLLPLGNTVVIDLPPTNLSYIPNSTTLNGTPIPDSISGTPFPLDAPGYTIPVILRGGTSIFKYRTLITGGGVISNVVTVGGTSIFAANTLIPGTNSSTLVFTDAAGNPVASYAAGSPVFLTLTDPGANTATNTVQTLTVVVNDATGGDYEAVTLTETGSNTGVFRNTTGLPTSLSAGVSQQDGTLHVAAGDLLTVTFTDPSYGNSCSASAVIQTPALSKVLYLSVNGSTNGVQALNRVDPVAAGHGPMRSSVDLGSGSGPFAGAWPYRQAITINHTNVFATDQTNFPVLVNLAANAGLKNHAQASGNDILFTAGDGATVLPYEREKFTNSTGALVAWVKVPILSSTTNTVLYMYYGNSGASDQQNAHNVWDSNFKLVYHLGDAGPTTAVDSTTNANNGTATGATFGATGQIDGATSYTNGNTTPVSYISAASAPGISANQSFSYEMWIAVTGAYVNQSSMTSASGSWFLDRAVTSQGLVGLIPVGSSQFGYETRYDDGTGLGGPTGGTVSSNWTHVVMVRDYNTAFRLYVNGIQVGTTTDSGSEALTPPIPRLGRHVSFTVNTPGLNGLIDEFRISSIARSAGWIQTEYTNQASPATFYSIGAETTNTTTSATTNATAFAQTPAFCSAFTMPSNSVVTITNYITITNGVMPVNPAITAMLQYNGVNFITLTNPIYTSGSSNLVWSGALPANVVVPAGQGISYVISNTQPGVTFHINYDSTNAPSKITLPTTSVIGISSFGIYNAPYPGGNLVSSPIDGATLYVRTVATDPFGSYDITSVNLAIAAPAPSANVNVTLTNSSVVASDSCSKTYEYAWQTGPTLGGYNVSVTANEGTEGITAVAATAVTLTVPDLGPPSTTEFTSGNNGPATNAFGANSTVCVRVTDFNENLNPNAVETVVATVSSSSGGSEPIVLTETGTNTGVFTTCISASTTSGSGATNGVLFAPVGSVLTASYTEPQNPTDQSSATATILPPPGVPGVTVNKTLVSPANGQALVGDTLEYSVQAINTGSTVLTNVSLTDTFPAASLSFQSASFAPNTVTAGSLVWTNVGPLTPGQATNLAVFFTATAPSAAATNSAAVAGSGAADSGAAIVTITKPALTVTKTLLNPTSGPVNIGGNVTFRIIVKNTGDIGIPTLPMEDSFSPSYFQFVSATIAPNGQGAGSLLWTNLAATVPLVVNASITNDVTMKVAGAGNPANNTATVDFAEDSNGKLIPAASSTVGLTTGAARITGSVYNDADQSGTLTPGDTGLAGVTLQLFTDPNGDGDPADGSLVQLTSTDASGYYEFLNLPLGSYVIVETDLPGFVSTAPVNNRIAITITSLTTNANNNFFDYLPNPVVYATINGTVWDDISGGGTNTAGAAGIAYVTIDLVQDLNTNGVADQDEPVAASTLTDTNGAYSFQNVTPGRYVILETDLYGYYSTGDSQPPNDNQISLAITAGIVTNNNDFFDRLLPVAVNDTASGAYQAPVTINPLLNDISPNGDILTIVSAVSSNGAVQIIGATNVVFAPTNVGPTTIIYTINDQHGGSSSAVITVIVTNSSPVVGWTPLSPIIYGTPLGPDQLNATSNVLGSFNYTPGLGMVLNAGAYTLNATFTPADTNYTTVNLTAPLVVQPAPLVVAANSTNKVYGQTNPVLTVSYSGFVNSETTNVLSGAPVLSTTATAGSPAGSYPITVSQGTLSNLNYSFSFTNGTLQVQSRALTITANSTNKVYGQALAFGGTEFTASGLTNGDSVSSVSLSSAGAGTNAGVAGSPYSITVSGAVGSGLTNYSISYVPGTLTVSPAALGVSANNQTRGYGQTNPVLTVSYSGFVNSETTNVLSGATVLSTTATVGSPAGSYPITVSQGTLSDANYSFSFTNGTLQVLSKVLTITANSSNKVYGQALVFAGTEFTASGLTNGDSVSSVSLSSAGAGTNAGVAGSPYSITVSGAVGSGLTNYSISYVPGTLTVSPAALGVSANNQTRGYGQTNPVLTVSYSGFVNSETTNVLSGAPVLSTTATAGSPAGSYPITVSQGTLSDANYSFSFTNGTLQVLSKVLTITANSSNKVYGQALVFAGTEFTASGLTNGDSVSSVSLSSAGAGTNAGVAGSPYSITVSGAVGSGLTNYSISYVPGTLTVSPAVLGVSANNQTRGYGQTNPVLTVSYSGFVNSETTNVLSGAPVLSTTATAGSPAGSYPITVSQGTLSDANYSFSFTNGTLQVQSRALTITANSTNKVYGQALAFSGTQFTASGLTNGDSVSSVSLSSAGAGTNAGVAGSPYSITVSGAVGSGLTNYSISYVPGTLTVSPAALGVSANNQTRGYGQTNPVLTVSYSGFVNGETTNVLSGAPVLSTTATVGSPAGSYPITVSQGTLSDANYSFSFTNGTLQVLSRTLTITANSTNKVYGQALAFGGTEFTASGLTNGDSVSSVSLSSAGASTNAGVAGSPYSITVSGAVGSGLTNYSISYVPGTLTVSPAALGVSANNQTRGYGQTNPVLTVSYSGFVNSETTNVLSGAPVLSTTATAGSPAGSYPITVSQGTLSDANYSFSFTNGTLQVLSRTLTITANSTNKVYGQALAFGGTEFTASGLTNGDSVSSVSLSSAGAGTNAGVAGSPYSITVSGAVGSGLTNYSISYVPGTLTVSPAALGVSANNQSRGYGQTNPVLTVSYSGFVNSETTNVLSGAPVLSTTATVGSPAGSYPITVSQGTLSDANYSFSFTNGTLQVQSRALTITANSTNKVYGQAVAFSGTQFTASGLTNGDSVSSVSLSSAGASTNAGVAGSPYSITASSAVGSGLTNYSISYVPGTLTVSPAALGVSANNQTRGYGQTNPVLTVSYSGFVNSETTNVLSGAPVLSTTATAGSPAGSYPITVSQGTLSNLNYSFSFTNGTLQVQSRALTITANSTNKVYGQALAFGGTEFTASGLTNGDSVSSVSLSSAGAGTNAGVAGSPYSITVSGAVGSGLTNYSISYVPGTLTVSPAALGVSANNQTRGYGQTNPVLTVSYSGFVNSETTNVLSGATVLSTTATVGSPAGSYPITVSQGTLSDANYSFSFTNGTLQVLSKVLTITANSSNKVYGQALVFAGTEFTASGLTNGDSVSSVSLSSAGAGTNAGVAGSPYSITVSGAVGSGLTNYSISYVPGTLTVSPAVLGVSANNQTRGYGQTNPVLTVSYSGFVNSETTNVLSGAPVLSTTATAGSPAGSYPITVSQGTLSDANYSFSFTNGTLQVQSRALTITANSTNKVYGQALAFSGTQFTASGLTNGDSVSSVSLSSAGAGTNAGVAGSPYSITVSGAVGSGLTNYSINYVTGTLTVNPAALGVSANNQSRGYGQTNPVLTVSYSGFVNSETTNVLSGAPVLSTTATTGSPAGSYPITVSQGTLSDANYSFSFTNGALTVSVVAPVVVWASLTPITYGTPVGSNQLNATSSVPGQFTYTPTNGTALNAGTNTLGVLFTPTDTNYTSVNLTVSLVVLPAPLTVAANNETWLYGATNPPLTYTMTGFVNDETTNVVSGSPTLATTATSSSPVGTYPITIGLGSLSASNYTFILTNGTLTIAAAPAVSFGIFPGTNVFNPQTGLFEQQVIITNTGTATASAVRLLVGNLRTNVYLYNADGTNTADGRPYVQYNAPLNPGSNVTLILEFYVPDRLPFTDTLEAEVVLPIIGGTFGAEGVPVTRWFVDYRIAGDPRYVIEFASVPGSIYTILYSNDLQTWYAATPSITANANVTQWYDDGPPETDSKPFTGTSRYYRVLVAPANP